MKKIHKKKNTVGIILAGGRSTRAGYKPKYLFEYRGKPLIVRIVEVMKPIVTKIIIVIPPESDKIKQVLKNFSDIEYVIQNQPLGTAHALLCTDHLMENTNNTILVSYADKPLITTKTLKNLMNEHMKNSADLTIATTILSIPGNKGRIIRINGRFSGVVEAKDANDEILKIKEVNTGFIVAESKDLYKELRKIKNNNKAGEYYLTDVYAEYLKDGLSVHTVEIPPEESCDINTIEEFKGIEEWIKKVKNQN